MVIMKKYISKYYRFYHRDCDTDGDNEENIFQKMIIDIIMVNMIKMMIMKKIFFKI